MFYKAFDQDVLQEQDIELRWIDYKNAMHTMQAEYRGKFCLFAILQNTY